MADQPEITGIRTVRTVEIIDKQAFDQMFLKAMPTQRHLSITLEVPAVYKDGVFYVPQGCMEWKTKDNADV